MLFQWLLTAALETPSSIGGRGGGRRIEPRYLGPIGLTMVCSVVWGETVCVCVCVCVVCACAYGVIIYATVSVAT